MLKQRKALLKVKAPVKTSTRRSITIPNPIVEVVVPEARQMATRTISRLQRYL